MNFFILKNSPYLLVLVSFFEESKIVVTRFPMKEISSALPEKFQFANKIRLSAICRENLDENVKNRGFYSFFGWHKGC